MFRQIYVSVLGLGLCTFLSLPGIVFAATPVEDEKIAAPPSQAGSPPPSSPGESSPSQPGVIVVPQTAPEGASQGVTIILPPSATPEGSPQGASTPDTTLLPDTGVTVIPTPPTLPVPPGQVVIPTPPVSPEKPGQSVFVPKTTNPLKVEGNSSAKTLAPDIKPVIVAPGAEESEKRLTPLEFLPKTPITGEKKKPENPTNGTSQPAKAEKPTNGTTQAPKAASPEKKTPQVAEAPKPKPGDTLRIPPDAAKKGDLSFLEGCWRGTRPEYWSKRTITERFCFDKNGKGKRQIIDPSHAGNCYGATQGSFDAHGYLAVTSEQAVCTSGRMWGQAEMICEGQGASTPCFWDFKDTGGGTQRYKIPLIKE